MEQLTQNKATVSRFNLEVIERGNENVFADLMAADFINHTAASGTPSGAGGMLRTFMQVLRPAFPDLHVEILDQVAENDKVTTRKTINGTHRGDLFGIAPTGMRVSISVIDIVRLRNGQYVEHWGINNFAEVIEQLRRHSK